MNLKIALLALPLLLTSCVAAVPFIEPDHIPSNGVIVSRGVAVPRPVQVSERGYSKTNRRVIKLIRRLDDPSATVRTHAAYWLGEAGSDALPAVSKLNALARIDPSNWVRRAAVKAIGKIGEPASLSTLIDALKDRDRWVSHSAANVLKRWPGNEAKAALKNFGRS